MKVASAPLMLNPKGGASPLAPWAAKALLLGLLTVGAALTLYSDWRGPPASGATSALTSASLRLAAATAGARALSSPALAMPLSDVKQQRAQEIIRRFKFAEEHVHRVKEVGKHQMFTFTACPGNYSIGGRNKVQAVPEHVGNACEPWMPRFAIEFLDRLLDTDMRVLEWGLGSSTQWVLMRVRHLTSIEHDKAWARRTADHLGKVFTSDDLRNRWSVHIPELVGEGNATLGNATAPAPQAKKLSGNEKYRDYARAAFLPEGKRYDFVSIDGRSRVACLQRALGLLKPQGGLLLLNNSDRKKYAKAFELVPAHWLSFEARTNHDERVTVWLSCDAGSCGEDFYTQEY